MRPTALTNNNERTQRKIVERSSQYQTLTPIPMGGIVHARNGWAPATGNPIAEVTHTLGPVYLTGRTLYYSFDLDRKTPVAATTSVDVRIDLVRESDGLSIVILFENRASFGVHTNTLDIPSAMTTAEWVNYKDRLCRFTFSTIVNSDGTGVCANQLPRNWVLTV